ncbi:hypothetical protein G7Y89_g7973 [Cudoniella acicularis]|uniref:Uncharacterized protein n=1 Tax=Cudoniella acicularis TaxID=354080 RepID=A0A8H4RHH9_9HELO|nr:hypothetical protein G7Y89_g7973 [Cudoniella acicularis]
MDSLYPELDSVANESQRSSFTKPRACFNPNCTFPFGPACAKCSAEFDRHHQKRKAEKEARVKRWIQEDAEDLHFPPELVARSQVDNGMLFQRKSSTSSGGTFLPTSSTQQSLVSPTQREGDTGSGSPSQHSGGSSKSSGATISQKPQTRLSIEAIRARSQRWLPKSTSSEATVISRLARGEPGIEEIPDRIAEAKPVKFVNNVMSD